MKGESTLTTSDENASEEIRAGESPALAASDQFQAVERSEPFATTSLREQLRPALLSVPLLSLLTGLVFPIALAVPARLLFPSQSKGSLIVRDDIVVGSRLIGQISTRPGDFHPRPSAAGGGYDATASGGTNLGPANSKLRDGAPDDSATPKVDESFSGVRQLAEEFRRRNGLPGSTPLPIDAVTRSGSGLDPHISPSNAALQVARVARERNLSEKTVRQLVDEHTYGRQLGFLGSPRVSVLELNFALDRATAFPLSPTSR
jgi:potassium-transporting ATPase KdpC subunit